MLALLSRLVCLISLLGGVNLDRVSVWRWYIYLPWRVHRDICLMTIKCSERSTVLTGLALAVQPCWRQLSADVAGCAATCDVDKLAEHGWDIWQSVGREEGFYQLRLTTWLWLIDSTTDIACWRRGSGYALMTGTSQHRIGGRPL